MASKPGSSQMALAGGLGSEAGASMPISTAQALAWARAASTSGFSRAGWGR